MDSKLYKCIRLSDMSVSTLSEAELKLILEGDSDSSLNTKGDAVKGLSRYHHAVVIITSNLNDAKACQTAIKSDRQASMSVAGYELIVGKRGRIGVTIRGETAIPILWQRDLPPCRRCAGLFICWLVKCGRDNREHISLDEVGYDSDSDNEFCTDVPEKSSMDYILNEEGRKRRGLIKPSDDNKEPKRCYLLSDRDLELLRDAKKLRAGIEGKQKTPTPMTGVASSSTQSQPPTADPKKEQDEQVSQVKMVGAPSPPRTINTDEDEDESEK